MIKIIILFTIFLKILDPKKMSYYWIVPRDELVVPTVSALVCCIPNYEKILKKNWVTHPFSFGWWSSIFIWLHHFYLIDYFPNSEKNKDKLNIKLTIKFLNSEITYKNFEIVCPVTSSLEYPGQDNVFYWFMIDYFAFLGLSLKKVFLKFPLSFPWILYNGT